MENASKALIIAGAILLSIAIIGVGMFVFQNVSGLITSSSDMSQEQIDTYNGDFTVYEGDKRGTIAKQLCKTVRTHNLNAQDPSEKIILQTTEISDPENCPAPTKDGATGTTTTEINNIDKGLLSGKTYTITLGYDKSSGLVTTISIVVKK